VLSCSDKMAKRSDRRSDSMSISGSPDVAWYDLYHLVCSQSVRRTGAHVIIAVHHWS
jgi:hypothetical protein